MDYKNMTAPCGIPCFECNAHKAKSNDTLRKGISERIGMDYEKCYCDGCRNREGKCFLFEKNTIFPEGNCMLFGNDEGQCKIYLCTQKKGIHNCGECKNFPCDLLHPLADKADRIPQNLKVYNLCLIKKMGLEKWGEQKAAKGMQEYMTKKFGS